MPITPSHDPEKPEPDESADASPQRIPLWKRSNLVPWNTVTQLKSIKSPEIPRTDVPPSSSLTESDSTEENDATQFFVQHIVTTAKRQSMQPGVDEVCLQLLIQTFQARDQGLHPKASMICWQKRPMEQSDSAESEVPRHSVIKRVDGQVDCLEHIYEMNEPLPVVKPKDNSDAQEFDISTYVTSHTSKVTEAAQKVFAPSTSVISRYVEFWKSGQAVGTLQDLCQKGIGLKKDENGYTIEGGEAKKVAQQIVNKWKQWATGNFKSSNS